MTDPTALEAARQLVEDWHTIARQGWEAERAHGPDDLDLDALALDIAAHTAEATEAAVKELQHGLASTGERRAELDNSSADSRSHLHSLDCVGCAQLTEAASEQARRITYDGFDDPRSALSRMRDALLHFGVHWAG